MASKTLAPNSSSVSASDVPATIYLNERLVLDMLASLQDGFAQSVRVDRVRADSGTKETEATAGGSVPVLSLIGINIGGRVKRDASQSDTQTQSQERTHTVSSLFSLLRSELRSRGLVTDLKTKEDLPDLHPGMFVESEVRVRRNGLVEVVRAVKAFMEISESIASIDNRVITTAGRATKPSPKVDQTTKRQMEWILSKAKPGKFEDFVGVVLSDDELRIAMPVDIEMFFDQSLSEALNSDLRIFGKVTRVLRDSNDDQINLLRGTEFGALSAELWKTVIENLATDQLRKAVTVPSEIEVVVSAPGVQLIPIALFA